MSLNSWRCLKVSRSIWESPRVFIEIWDRLRVSTFIWDHLIYLIMIQFTFPQCNIASECKILFHAVVWEGVLPLCLGCPLMSLLMGVLWAGLFRGFLLSSVNRNIKSFIPSVPWYYTARYTMGHQTALHRELSRMVRGGCASAGASEQDLKP